MSWEARSLGDFTKEKKSRQTKREFCEQFRKGRKINYAVFESSERRLECELRHGEFIALPLNLTKHLVKALHRRGDFHDATDGTEIAR